MTQFLETDDFHENDDASKQLEGTTLGDINNAHEYNITKPVFITGIHAFLLFKRYKGPEYRIRWVSAWRELPDCLTLPCCLWGASGTPELLLQHGQLAQVRAGPGLLCSLVGLGLALDMQNHQAVVTVILTDYCIPGTQQDWDSDLIYLSEHRDEHVPEQFFTSPGSQGNTSCSLCCQPLSQVPLAAAALPHLC